MNELYPINSFLILKIIFRDHLSTKNAQAIGLSIVAYLAGRFITGRLITLFTFSAVVEDGILFVTCLTGFFCTLVPLHPHDIFYFF